MARNKDFSDAQKATFGLFGGDPNGNAAPVDDISNQFKSGRSEKIQQIGIFDIAPDVSQPRRAMPSEIRAGWDGNPVNLPALYGDWLVWVGEEYRTLVTAILSGEEVERPAVDAQPVAEIAALIEIATLAGSIKRDGLMNPITVAKLPDGGYQIESGERRWLAYHLLHHTFGKDFSTIPARVVESVNRWRQAAENNTRSDLNAIGRARQFAVLLMDLIGWERFAAFDQFDNEQDFYAQIADGEAFRVPRGTGEKLVAALGLKSSTQLRQYRALLRLSPEVWRRADDESLVESRIRELIGDSVTIVTVEDEISASVEVVVSNGAAEGSRATHAAKKPSDVIASQALRWAKGVTQDDLRNEISVMKELVRQMEVILEKKR